MNCPTLSHELTVEAWLTIDDGRLEIAQTAIAKWQPDGKLTRFAAFDAGNTGGLSTIGYFGAVSAGRYIYFCPEFQNDLTTHGNVLRYDTHGDFYDHASYNAFDASNTSGLDCRGYYGGVFDGTHVYFIPRHTDTDHYHTHLLRHNVYQDMANPNAWEAFDIGLAQSAQSAAFDGRYIYFCPGYVGDPAIEGTTASKVIRYDTLSPFTQHDSYAVFDAATVGDLAASCFDGGAFDGRFAYFIPLSGGVPVRVDTTRPFDDATSWTAFDGKAVGMGMCVGGVFDGRWLYYVPYGHSNVVRFDTTGDFHDAKAWDSFDANGINGLRCGGFFDGRFVHFMPFINYLDQGGFKLHADFLRYDTAGAFDDDASWDAADASTTDGLKTVGFNAGAYDGRFFYCAPWRTECGQEPGQAGVNGRILRCDTLGDGGSFNLAACGYGHNGGLCAGTPGAMFTVNTTAGAVSCALNRSLSVGRHHLVGTYDSDSIKLYVDGKLAAESETPGAPIINSDAPVTVGELPGGTSVLRGSVHSGLIEDCCRDANWVGKRNP